MSRYYVNEWGVLVFNGTNGEGKPTIYVVTGICDDFSFAIMEVKKEA